MNSSRSFVTVAAATAVFCAGQMPRPALAAEVLLPNVPLIVSIDAVPNVFLSVDDSGSLQAEVFALEHYSICAYDGWLQEDSIVEEAFFEEFGRTIEAPMTRNGNRNSGNLQDYCTISEEDDLSVSVLMSGWTGNNNSNRIRFNMRDIFDYSNNAIGPSANCDNGNDVEQCEGVVQRSTDAAFGQASRLDMEWRIRSSSVNFLYYNPVEVYEPWVGGSTTYPDASFTAARRWPDDGVNNLYSSTINLSGFSYNVWIDDRGSSTVPPTPTSMTKEGDGVPDLWDSYVKVTVPGEGAPSCDLFSVTEANSWGLTAEVSEDVDCSAYTGGLTNDELRQNVANWFQYNHQRVHVINTSLGKILTELPNFRYGMGLINSFDVDVEMQSPEATSPEDYQAKIAEILDALYTSKRANGDTPMRGGLVTAGEYFAGNIAGKDSPITLSCQKNFALAFTDGFWDDDISGEPLTSGLGIIGDFDGDGAQIWGNNARQSTLVSDVTAFYYQTDLRPPGPGELENNVPTDAFDSASWQHMVTYTINFGVEGALRDTDDDGWPTSSTDGLDSYDWFPGSASTTTNGDYWDPLKADDMWKAAWNAKGGYITATSPAELVEALRDSLENIGRRIGGAASAAANSGSISSSSRIFQAKFDSTDWHGELLAFPVNDNGTLGSVADWDANEVLSAKTDAQMLARKVFTYNPNNDDGATFSWSGPEPLNNDQKALLNVDFNGDPDPVGSERGQERLEYILGDSSSEIRRGGDFRDRLNKLGDIVNSDPMFVGFPPFFYPFNDYQGYFTANLNRTSMIYLGANDGMLHGIRELDGEILFSYVPNKVIENLPDLTNPDYAHTFYVDGPAGYGDAYMRGRDGTLEWKSVLVGALRSGGQAVYALDVTRPDGFDADDVLWEFDDTVDPDLGYVWGEPQIKRVRVGNGTEWVAIFGNGLNNTEEDGEGTFSTTGQASLFVVFLEGGVNGFDAGDYIKIPVGSASPETPNGLFTPAAADVDGDFNVDFVYAGDLEGNMWKFDLTSTTPSEWKVDFSGQPFFSAGNDQPITDRPAIAAHPEGRNLGQLVLFGTGKFIETIDNETSGQPTQTMYALWDFDRDYVANNQISQVNGYDKTQLSSNSLSASGNLRVIQSPTREAWLDQNGDPDDLGWYIDLPATGERMIRRPVLRDNLVFFVTMTPDPDPCAAGGTGFISVLDIDTGAAPPFPVFDIDLDQDVTVGDDVVNGDDEDPSND
ncbi:MAG: PilC/PilY family type IV pilus protein, partial [Pseudomonadota bacterium]